MEIIIDENFTKNINSIIKEEKENEDSLNLIKNILFVCPKCFARSLNQNNIIPSCISCKGESDFPQNFNELVWDSIFYGWHYRIIYEKQLKNSKSLKFKPLLQQPSYDLLFLAHLVLFKNLKFINKKLDTSEKILIVLKHEFPESFDDHKMSLYELKKFEQYVSEYYFKNA